MGLLNNQGASVQGGAAPAAKVVDPQVKAAKKAEKEAAKKLVSDYFNPIRNTLEPKLIAAFELITKAAKAGGGGFGEPIFTGLFGDSPKVGDKVTLRQVIEKYYKGIDYMQSKCRIWKQKNVADVEYVFNPQNPMDSHYIIKKLGA